MFFLIQEDFLKFF